MQFAIAIHTVFENHRKSRTDIASEASYVYILLNKNDKKCQK